MKKNQNKLRMMINALLTTIMGWIAVSCNHWAPMYGPLVELYAPPAPRDLLQIKGQVTNKENESLESMQVSCHVKYGKEWVNIADAEYTDKEGNFNMYTYELNPDTMRVIVKDTTNVYEPDTTIITSKDIEILKENITLEDGWTVVAQTEVDIQMDKSK